MTVALVTGATTPVGGRIVAELLDAGVERVLAVGREPVWGHAVAREERVSYRRADLCRPREVRELMFGPVRELGVDVVIHGALHRRPDEGPRVRRLNVESTRLLLRLSEFARTPRRFVFVGTGLVYRVRAEEPDVVREDHPLHLVSGAPQWVHDRVEADLVVCTRMGMSDLSIAVLRLAEVFGPDCGSQLYDYLGSAVCLRPLGYDPMLNLLSVEDAGKAVRLAALSDARGIFNIPGRDTLPLTAMTRAWGRRSVPVPGTLMGPLYRLRSTVLGSDFRYDLNQWRLHFSAVLDGARAEEVLGYEPTVGWPDSVYSGAPAVRADGVGWH